MNYKTGEHSPYRSGRALLIAASIALFLVAPGCARKPWRQPVTEDRSASVIDLMAQMRQSEQKRSSCIDADVNIFFTSNVRNRAVGGYMQLMQPSSIKFVTSNPLGQPLVVFVSDGHDAQFVNTMDAFFTDGDLTAFAQAFDIPPVAYASDWGTWLTGRLPRTTGVTSIREDEKERGIWVSVGNTAAMVSGTIDPLYEHVLIDPAERRILSRVFTDSSDTVEARIDYDGWIAETTGAAPLQPGRITISGLDYGGRLVLDFSGLRAMEGCRKSNFLLNRPPGYRYQPLATY